MNKDYDAAGYFYGIDVPAGTTGALNVQVYDPAFVHVGDNCGGSDTNAQNSLTNAATLTAAQIPGYSGSVTPATRYSPASSSAFCNGDNYYGDGSNTANPWTTWTLRAPDISTWDPTNNPIVCQAEFPGVYPETSNDLPNGTVNSGRLKTLLQQATTYPGTNPARTFASFFRQWVSLCNVPSPVQGTYFLQVQTGKKIDGTAAPNGGGSNRFSIRVGVGANFAATNGRHVYGNAKMGLQDHRRVEFGNPELQRAMGDLADPDPCQLHVQRRQRARVLDEAPVRVPGGHHGDRHDDVVRLHPR